jgi:hypothetical protein
MLPELMYRKGIVLEQAYIQGSDSIKWCQCVLLIVQNMNRNIVDFCSELLIF